MKFNDNNTQFIIALTEHRLFGHILIPYFVVPNTDGTFYSIVSTILTQNIKTNPELFSEAQKELIELIESYSDENLTKKFSKKIKSSKIFFEKVDQDYFNKTITPFIDKQIVSCIEIIRKENIRIYIKAAKYNNVYDEDLVYVDDVFAQPIFNFDLDENGLKYYLSIERNNEPIKIRNTNAVIIADFPCRMLLNNKLICFNNFSGKRLTPFFEKEYMTIPLNVVDKYMKSFVHNVVGEHKVKAKGFEIVNVESERKSILSIERGLDLNTILVLSFSYGSKIFPAGKKGNVEVEYKKQNGKYVFYKHQRNTIWEKEIIVFFNERSLILTADQLVFSANVEESKNDKKYSIINWINKYSGDLKSNNIFLHQKDIDTKFYTGNQNLSVNFKMEGDWFDMYAVVHFGDYQIPFIRLKKNILSGKREYILPNGEIAILPKEWFVKFKSILPFTESNEDTLKFSKHHFNLLKGSIQEMDAEISEKIKQFESKEFELIENPIGLNAVLRDYQKEGYSWMNTLSKNNFGGCLADDMGLGKTIQTLTLLLNVKQENKKENKKEKDSNEEDSDTALFPRELNNLPATMIIVPTSLVHNWHNEIKKFTPQLKLYKHVGTQRKKISKISDIVNYYDVVITTYGTIRNDYKIFEKVVFNYLILDESQYIKNSGSKTYNAVCSLNSNYKLVITGTPIENSLSDLWSQLNFLNKGLLGNLNYFKKEFILPIEKKNDEDKQKLLYKIISPFILRRTKEEVAKDLPPLTEQVRYCEMTKSQEKKYEEQKSTIRNKLLENIEKHGESKVSFLALQGLTRMRQLANHPSLINIPGADSGKFNEVMRSLENLMAEKHKVLIFSSFVTHLKLFQEEFEEKKWEYCLLTGLTRDRESVIKDFQTNEKKRIFLISLKAGGVGLNLTSADYIFILDPWWNPASENQAINRAHRIGQNKKVFVYRFITENSIEEKIQNLKDRKSALADKFIQSNNPFKSISKHDLLDLFE